jgi:hypothetical protein
VSVDVEVEWKGKAASAAAKRGAIRGLQMATELLLAEAVKIVPLDEAALQDSGKTSVDEEKLEGKVTFDTPYAVVQHEDLTLHHPNGRKAKYLETPWRENSSKFAELIAFQIKRALGG